MLSAIAAGLHLAQVSVYFTDEDFIELFMWGVAFVFIIVILFILNRVFRDQVGSRVRNQRVPLGVAPEDLEKMQKAGQVTDEELKAIRRAMARKILERAEHEAQAQKVPHGADKYFQTIESVAQTKASMALRGTPGPPPEPARAPSHAPDPARSALPPHLEKLVALNDFDLEQMVSAGFLHAEDAEIIKAERGRR